MMKKQTEQKQAVEKKTPIKKFRAGLCSVSIWENQSKDGNTFYTASIDVSYKDKDGNWAKSNSLKVTDMPKVSMLLSKAYEYISLQESDEN